MGNGDRGDPFKTLMISLNVLARCIESQKILKTLNRGAPTFSCSRRAEPSLLVDAIPHDRLEPTQFVLLRCKQDTQPARRGKAEFVSFASPRRTANLTFIGRALAPVGAKAARVGSGLNCAGDGRLHAKRSERNGNPLRPARQARTPEGIRLNRRRRLPGLGASGQRHVCVKSVFQRSD